MDNFVVILINLLLGVMAAHLIKKGFEIFFTDCPIESFEAESEGPFPFSFLPPANIGETDNPTVYSDAMEWNIIS